MPSTQPDSGTPPHWVVLGVASSKRARGLQAARAGLGLPPAQFVEWQDWLASPQALQQQLLRPCRFKIEPPGDDAHAHLHLMELGNDRLGRPRGRAPAHGELLATDAWFAGFSAQLAHLDSVLAGLPHVKPLNPPADILAMTDKLLCQQRLQAHAVPTPPLLGAVSNYDHFIDLMRQHGHDRVYLKARYGSSAAGVLAYRHNGRGQAQATTSAKLVDDGGGARLFNVKRLRSYDRPAEIRQLVDSIAAQGAYAEAWIPKPRLGAGHFDLRVLSLDGRPAHRVARVGERTMTNLHLDCRRADPLELMDPAQQALLEGVVRQAARAFPDSQLIGFDLVVNRQSARVLEANAFGDLLPGLLWQGRDTYAASACA